jgi:hypothetical protein
MYTVKQASEILNISIRGVQLKCKKHKVPKVANEFQITDELLEVWKNGSNEQRTTIQVVSKNDKRTTLRWYNNITPNFWIIFILTLVIVIGGFLQYTSNNKLINEIRSNAKKIETDLTKRLNKAENKVDSLQKENVAILKNNNVLQDSIKKLKP